MDTIDQLPHLCLKKIFSFLNLRGLISCRAVNRQFKFYADEATVDELIVRNEWCECSSWFEGCHQTYRRIDHESSLSPNAFAFASLKSSPFKLNEQLKYLHVHLGHRFDLNSLSKHLTDFRQLEHLEIRGSYQTKTVTLILPNLKMLYIGYQRRGPSFILNTPKLEVLKCYVISRIQVEHPETIKRLECGYHGEPYQVDKFKNVQVLILNSLVRNFGAIYNCLSDWVHLRELHLNATLYDHDVLSGRRKGPLNWNSVLFCVMSERAKLKREELKLYTHGVLLIDEEQLNYYGSIPLTGFCVRNYRHLYRDSYFEPIELDYKWIADLELSSEFFVRFPRIQRLIATGPVERDRFEWFLQNATELTYIRLTNTSLDQAFMERLPKLISRLGSLKLCGSCGQITNFDFILQFEQLWCFKTKQDLGSLDLATKAFKQLEKLCFFEFKAGNQSIDIYRPSTDKGNYNLSIQDFRKENLKWNEVVALYEQMTAEQ